MFKGKFVQFNYCFLGSLRFKTWIFWMLIKLRSKELRLNRNLLPFMLAPKSPQICPRDGDTRPHMQMTVYKSDQVENAGH